MVAGPRKAGSERNLRLYSYYVVSQDFRLWMPVFILYFTSALSLAETLYLEAVYYFSVVALEVPSGYLSDRAGRRQTLILSALGEVTAYILFACGNSFMAFALGQIALGVSMACNSGTDSSLHFESLQNVSKEAEFGTREARLAAFGLYASSTAALAGGLLGSLDLRLPYLFGIGIACFRLTIAYSFFETVENSPAKSRLYTNVRQAISHLRNPILSWCFVFILLMTVLNHIPYEFYQPYLHRLGYTLQQAPMLAGLHLSLTTFLSAPVAKRSVTWASRWGIFHILLLAALIQVGIIGAMGLFQNELVAILCLARSTPRALMHTPLQTLIVPAVPNNLRATYLSLQSLAGRVLFGGTLTILAQLLGVTSLSTVLLGTSLSALLATMLVFNRFPAKELFHSGTYHK
jgi:MFS family permease